MGIFAYPTMSLLGLKELDDSVVKHDPDVTLHEVKKFCNLALKCNPTVLELLWLDEYEELNPLGEDLVYIRESFLSKKYVMNSYLGYADQQFQRLKKRSDGKFDSDTGNRTGKHARHLVRLLIQGEELYTTGNIQVRLKDPDFVRDLAPILVEDPDRAGTMISEAKNRMLKQGSPLGDEPNSVIVECWLKSVRRVYFR